MNDNSDLITNKEIIDIYSTKYNHNPKHFCIYGYKFHDMMLEIKINFNETDKIYYIETYSLPYEYFDILIDTSDETYIINSIDLDITFTTIERVIEFLLCDMRKNYVYSKILNFIISKDRIVEDEKNMLAEIILCDNSKIDKCCVCYDINSIYTKCEHNLCRMCYYKIKYTASYPIERKCCPMCRKYI